MPDEESEDDTRPQGGGEGILLAQRAEDTGDWKPVAVWLSQHPDYAAEVAGFLGDDSGLKRAVSTPLARSGVKLGGIELKGEIGCGGMGVVYQGYDPGLKRDVAVKVVRSEHALSEVELARLRSEGEAVASLDHRNIVPILSSGESEGSPYLVMPLMTGGSMAAWLKDLGPERCPARKAAELVRDIALGVHHAHQRGLIHRDLKPSNILFDHQLTPRIADFGLARKLDASVTASLGIAGTASYMAPEQARGEPGLTTAVDVYALGVILFEMLAGRTPFAGGDVASVLRRVIEEQPPLLRSFRADVPADLEAICLKCLEKKPRDRYHSAEALAKDLGNYLDERAVDARPPGFWDWLRQLARIRPEAERNPLWPVNIWLGLIILVANGSIYGLVRRGCSGAEVWGVKFAGLVCIVTVLWWYMLRRFRQIPVADRHSMILASGSVLIYLPLLATYVPLSLSAPGRSVLAIYPLLAICSGLGLFTLGSTYWSRFFPIGIVVMASAPLFARWPDESPILYGVLLTLGLWYWAYAKFEGFGYLKSPTQSD